jgi:hypothetical protein
LIHCSRFCWNTGWNFCAMIFAAPGLRVSAGGSATVVAASSGCSANSSASLAAGLPRARRSSLMTGWNTSGASSRPLASASM